VNEDIDWGSVLTFGSWEMNATCFQVGARKLFLLPQVGAFPGLHLYIWQLIAPASLHSTIKWTSLCVLRLSADQIGLHVSTCSDNRPQKLELTATQLHRRKPLREALVKAAAEPAENATRGTIPRSNALLG
jgi:hypothetical protein